MFVCFGVIVILLLVWVNERVLKRIKSHNTNMIVMIFFFNDKATPKIYNISLNNALPILEKVKKKKKNTKTKSKKAKPTKRQKKKKKTNKKIEKPHV